MRYTFDVLDAQNKVLDTLASESEAHEYIAIMRDNGANTVDWNIRKQEHATVTGLGRDPDLH